MWLPRNDDLPQSYVHIFMCTGDNGSDQLGLRNSLRTLFASEDRFSFILFFSMHCLKHASHLSAQSNLHLCDKLLKRIGRSFKYFSSVATLSHRWRGHLSKMRTTWWKQHKDDHNVGSYRATFRTPPLAIAGRWASVDGCFVLFEFV